MTKVCFSLIIIDIVSIQTVLGRHDMNTDYNAKKYEPFQIPIRENQKESAADKSVRQSKSGLDISRELQRFAEIEISGTSGSQSAQINKPQSIESDEKRKIFTSMRQIARENPSARVDHSKYFYKPTLLNDMSKVFYKQAVFMQDFEDDFCESVPFSAYYPYYQLMNNEQLRTYFTWRTGIRKGVIKNTSLSYAYVYIYELLNNIGVADPPDGLNKLMDFRRVFCVLNPSVDKYLLKWLKDYHIYYELPSFRNFVIENKLGEHYPEISECEPADSFEMFVGISKYDIRESVFYSEETHKLISGCVNFVIERLRGQLQDYDISFDDLVFGHINGKSVWIPFSRALFYPRSKNPDKQVAISEKEIYVLRQNKWTFGSITESGRQFVGYIIKQTEAILRSTVRFKYKLAANPAKVIAEQEKILSNAGISLEKEISSAVLEFYREFNRKVVSINETALEKIRQEALITQEKLIVPNAEPSVSYEGETPQTIGVNVSETSETQQTTDTYAIKAPKAAAISADEIPDSDSLEQTPDEWTSLRDTLSSTELEALTVILRGGDIRQFSDLHSVMTEILIDGINQKAYDIINDNILDFSDDITVYEEYSEKLTEAVIVNG